MRTIKRNVFILDHGDDVVIEYRGAEIRIITSSLDLEQADMLEVHIPAGHAMSGLIQNCSHLGDDHPISFADGDDLKEEVKGHLRFITFSL